VKRAPGILPWGICFAIFGIFPLGFALVLSFLSYNPLRPDLTHAIGFANYTRALTSPSFWHALRTTAIFVVGTLPVTLTLAYFVAALLGRLRHAEGFFRAAIFFPATLSMVVIALVFKTLYAEEGLLNGWLAAAGLPHVHWLQNPALALGLAGGRDTHRTAEVTKAIVKSVAADYRNRYGPDWREYGAKDPLANFSDMLSVFGGTARAASVLGAAAKLAPENTLASRAATMLSHPAAVWRESSQFEPIHLAAAQKRKRR